MRIAVSSKGLLLGLCILAASATVMADKDAKGKLLESARYWQQNARSDLAEKALEKYLLSAPDDADVFFELGMLGIRTGEPEKCSKILTRMRKALPKHPRTRELLAECRVATSERLAMARLRQLADNERYQEASEALQKLFPDGPPPGRLGLEYLRIYKAAGRNQAQLAGMYKRLLKESSAESGVRAARSEFTVPARSPEAGKAVVSKPKAKPLPDYRKLAESALKDGNKERARLLLERAVRQKPSDPWLRHDLADLYIDLQDRASAYGVMESGLQANPGDAEMRFAAALVFESLDMPDKALRQLSLIPAGQLSDGMRSMKSRLAFDACLSQAEASALRGCERYIAGDSERRDRLIDAWMEAGLEDHALRRMAFWQQNTAYRLPVAYYRIKADRLAASGTYPNAVEAYERLLDMPEATDDDRLAYAGFLLANQQKEAAANALVRVWKQGSDEAARIAAAKQLRQLGLHDIALPMLIEAVRMRPDDPWLRHDLARSLIAKSRPEDARFVMAEGLQRQPDEVDMRYASALILDATDRPDAALAQLDAIPVTARSDSMVEMRDRLVFNQCLALSAEPEQLRGCESLAGNNPDRLRTLASNAERNGAYDLALGYYERASQWAEPDGKQAIAEDVDAIQARRQAWFEVGYDAVDKPGTPGYSSLDLKVLPMELRWPIKWVNQLIFKVDPTDISAGRLQLGDAVDFGQFATQLPANRGAFFPVEASEETGVSVGVAYETPGWGVDIGTTPIGFPEEYLVGGIRKYGELGKHDWELELSRRAVTSTFLSYSGAEDPVSREFWGASREDSLEFDFARYEADFDYFLRVDWHRITGENIPDNKGLIVRLGADRKVIKREEATLFVGVASSYWRYDKNQRFYTFGHGGYYSPQSYLTFSIPLDLRGRVGRWSYQLKGALAYTKSDEDDADFFPGRPDLQQAAIAAGENPIYAGGKGSGTSYSAKVALEYALTDQLSIGTSYALDRADFYEPNFLTFYIRHRLGSGTPRLFVPPKPVKPYKDY